MRLISRNIILALGLVGGFAVLYLTFQNSNKLDGLLSETSKLAEISRAQREVRNFLTSSRVPISKVFCAERSKEARAKLCNALELKSFENLGTHDDLWVSLDAITIFADLPGLSKETRRQIVKYYSDLSVSLNEDGALNYVLRTSDDKSAVYANDLYDAIIAQAVVCDVMPSYRPCRNGLRTGTREALRGLVDLIFKAKSDPRPYNMNNYLGSLQKLVEGDLI